MKTEGAFVKFFTEHAQGYTRRHYKASRYTHLWRRHILCLEFLMSQNYGPESRILDLGCGPGLLAHDLSQAGIGGIGLDAAPGMIDLCRERFSSEQWPAPWTFQLGDAEALPFPDAHFDGGAAAGVIEYMESDAPMLSEIRRVLKPGAGFILNVTNRFGYSTCLNPIMNPIKRLPLIKRFASPVRQTLASDGQPLVPLVFEPRRHRPAQFRRTLAAHGLDVVSDRYIGFSVLPAPFCTLTSRLTRRLDFSLDVLDGTPLRYVGASYLVTVRRR